MDIPAFSANSVNGIFLNSRNIRICEPRFKTSIVEFELTFFILSYFEFINNDLIIKGGLADYSAGRGCMVIKPYGYALWENMRDQLDKMFKETGHQNAYFPLFVPKSLFEAEEKNATGYYRNEYPKGPCKNERAL